MNSPVLFNSAELSLASYSTLVQGETRLQASALQAEGKGMSLTQATAFVARYSDLLPTSPTNLK